MEIEVKALRWSSGSLGPLTPDTGNAQCRSSLAHSKNPSCVGHHVQASPSVLCDLSRALQHTPDTTLEVSQEQLQLDTWRRPAKHPAHLICLLPTTGWHPWLVPLSSYPRQNERVLFYREGEQFARYKELSTSGNWILFKFDKDNGSGRNAHHQDTVDGEWTGWAWSMAALTAAEKRRAWVFSNLGLHNIILTPWDYHNQTFFKDCILSTLYQWFQFKSEFTIWFLFIGSHSIFERKRSLFQK